MPWDNSINDIILGFEANIRELRVFNDKIGTLAEQHDRSTIDELREDFIKIIGLDISKVKDISTDNNDIKIEFVESEEEKREETGGSEVKGRTQNVLTDSGDKIASAFKDPDNLVKIVGALQKFVKGAHSQGLLLRRGALVSLITYFEALISDIIHFYYTAYPAALPSDTRVLSLNDLKEIGTIEEAERFLISKESDSVLREGYDQQIRYFSERLKIDLRLLDEYSHYLIEINQRRNVVVHNNGIANRTYLKNVDNKLIEDYKVKEGDILIISREYLNKAIDVIYISGIVISQQCARKWDKVNKGSIDDLLVRHTYDALVEERYDLVVRIALYAERIKIITDKVKKIITINHAIALKTIGRQEDMEALLGKTDWSASSVIFQTALCALRAEREKFYKLLSNATKAGEVDKSGLEQWPLFREYRNDVEFRVILAECPRNILIKEE